MIVRRDAIVASADAMACALLGAPDDSALLGRSWASLVSYGDATAVASIREAIARGEGWHGTLRYVYVREPVVLETTVSPTQTEGGPVLIQLKEPAPATVPTQSPEADKPNAVVRAQLAAHDAMRDLVEPRAISRAVLQALATLVKYDWGTVVRLMHHGADTGASIVATYPSAMAGLTAGTAWSPLGTAEGAVVSSGEPSLDGDLTPALDGSPLRRLTAFGMRSRMLIPLYAVDASVTGYLALYCHELHGFTPEDGVHVEQTVRRLGEVIRDIAPAASPARRTSGAGTVAGVQAAAPPQISPLVQESQRLNVLGELVAGVAHELNNPLTAILGYTQILPTLEGDEREHAMRTIEDEAQRAARIVRNLLSFARQRPGERRPVDLEAVLRRVIDLRRYTLEMDDIRVVTRFGNVPDMRADEAQIEQVFLHLLNNAQQALRGRGGEVVVTTSTIDERIRISVADNGPGVPESFRGRIFEPFFTTREVGTGQGLGLAIVYGVVTDHQGRVWVEPSLGGGASFVVELPLDSKPVEGQQAPTPDSASAAPVVEPLPREPVAGTIEPGSTSGHAHRGMTEADPDGDRDDSTITSPAVQRPRVLVVDDEAPIRALTQELLRAAGYDVVTTENGAEALRRLEQERFDVIVTDVRMPGMGGPELYQHVQERWPSLSERMVFVTGDVEGGEGQALAAGSVRYLEKPFHTDELIATIREVMNRVRGI